FNDVAPPEHADYISTRLVLGNIYYETGYLNKAEDAFTQVLLITDSLQEISNPVTLSDRLSATFGMAMIYINTDRYEEADVLLQKLQAYCEKNPATNLELYATVMEAAAQLYGKTGSYQKAEELHNNAIITLRRARGGPNATWASFLSNLGSLYTDMKEYKKADSVLQKA